MNARQRFVSGFGSVIAATLLFNMLSFARAWLSPGCADCVIDAGVPFPFVSHGGFFTETVVIWRGLRDAAVATAGVATFVGLVSLRVARF